MYSNAIWPLVEAAYAHLEREFPGRDAARSEVMVRFDDPVIGHDQLDVIFKDCIVRFTGGNDPVRIDPKWHRDIIIAIDDEPHRYMTLARRAAREGWVVIPVEREAMIEMVLMTYQDRVLAVMLDHDMPGMDGREVAKNYLAERSFPVIITTNSTPGAKRIQAVLDEYGVPYHVAPAMGMLRDDVWMNILRELETR